MGQQARLSLAAAKLPQRQPIISAFCCKVAWGEADVAPRCICYVDRKPISIRTTAVRSHLSLAVTGHRHFYSAHRHADTRSAVPSWAVIKLS
ncbi:hypothetical protein JOB18_025871 [Solea senegalensis]|uniref:Uncharacterized protein n=1 Tax=Solea senegalensis TaxID=28829 RepID=A0AAV6QW11_SOLSE|nr:hypothetical protein JOB18_025871 [Solea senegalensis]